MTAIGVQRFGNTQGACEGGISKNAYRSTSEGGLSGSAYFATYGGIGL